YEAISSLWDFAEYGSAVYVFDELAKRVAARDLVRNVAPRKHLGVDDFFLGRGGLIDFAVLGLRRSFPNYPVILPDPCAALDHRGANQRSDMVLRAQVAEQFQEFLLVDVPPELDVRRFSR